MQQISARPKTRSMQVVEFRLGEPIEVYLRRRYLDDGATTHEIATELGLNNGTISRWMAQLGVEARFPGQRGKAVA